MVLNVLLCHCALLHVIFFIRFVFGLIHITEGQTEGKKIILLFTVPILTLR